MEYICIKSYRYFYSDANNAVLFLFHEGEKYNATLLGGGTIVDGVEIKSHYRVQYESDPYYQFSIKIFNEHFASLRDYNLNEILS